MFKAKLNSRFIKNVYTSRPAKRIHTDHFYLTTPIFYVNSSKN